jgi:RNA polymerase sigma-70 factor (ECF subfamily)
MTAVIRSIGSVGYSNKTDSQIWEEYKAGDEKALVYIFKQHYQMLFKYGIKFCQNKDLTKDCIQDIFTDLWDKRKVISSVQHIKTYLFKYFRRYIFNKIQQEKKNSNIDDFDFSGLKIESSFESVLINEQISSEMKERVIRAFQKLPKRQQELIYLRFYSDLTYEQIAEIMDLLYQSVRNLLHESLKMLRKDTTLTLAQFLLLFAV